MTLRSVQVPLLGAALFFVTSAPCASPSSGLSLDVEYAGCEAVLLPGPVCRLAESRELRVWVGASPEAIEIRAGGLRIDTTGEAIGKGQRFSLTVPPGVQRLDVLVDAPERQAAWSLSLADPGGTVAYRDLLREVDEMTLGVYHLILERQLTEAWKILAGIHLPAPAPAESRYYLAYYRGLLAEKAGDYRSAMIQNQEALDISERAKLIDLFQQSAEQEKALLLLGVGRFSEAAEILDGLPANGSCDKAQLLGNRAWARLLAREAGEPVEDPTRLLERALTTYETCKRKFEKRVNFLINLALAHFQQGRLSPAKDFLAQAHELDSRMLLPQRLWALDLEARIALREERPAEALRRFEDLEELALSTSSPDGRLRAALGQAQALQALGDRAAALETLRQAEGLLDEQTLQIPIHEGRETFLATRQALVSLHVEILLDQEKNAEALDVARHARSRMLRQLERSERLAGLLPDQRARWHDFLRLFQERRAALEEKAKDDWKLPSDQLLRERSARKAEARELRDLLDQAFRVLDDSTERPEETLRPPRPGELLLTWCPLPRGWVGFAADGETVKIHRFDMPALFLKGSLSQQLLVPFSAAIEKAERIRILPAGHLQEVDFHSLPFAGDVLLAKRPVVYGLDLPVRSSSARPSGQGRQALLVADPRDDLPGSLDEARTVRKVLEASSWTIEELKSAEASAEGVGRRLPEADLLHYAGHGIYSGFGGWDSSLLLAADTHISLDDLLAVKRVPAWVVLSGCDTGRSSTKTPVQSLGLAYAFLLAGSQGVVASTRAADDRTVPAFFAELYRQWAREPDLAIAIQRAQLSWRQSHPGTDWPGFRLFEP
ncbi:MAG TPA: CHAT domain-containing protein [Thermoanaerobaculia bacterium]|nr:CHAT domain-containing protein [Thermoanaerobaculia bacterium]